MPATVMRHPSASTPHLDCPCGCGGTGGCSGPSMPDCGERPPWGWWGFQLRKSWDDTRFLMKAIRQAVQDMLEDGTLGVDIPLKGVTDGSAAAPGMVGEFVTGSVADSVTLADSTAQVVALSPLILPPGDWDVEANNQIGLNFTSCTFFLSPVPAGASCNMYTMLSIGWTSGPPEVQSATMISPRTRLSVSVPTLLAFSMQIGNFTGASSTVDYTFTVTARRMR